MFRTMCRIVVTTLLIGVWLLGASPVAYGLVLCFERDGDVQLEVAYRGACVEPPTSRELQSPPSTAVLQKERGTHCETCVDVPVISAAGEGQRFVVPASPAQHQPIANGNVAVCLPRPDYALILLQPDVLPAPQSLILRSTVLLI